MTGVNGRRPEWDVPGMPESERRMWEAAQRTADTAPELRPGDDVYEELRPLLAGVLAPSRTQDRDAA